MIQKLPRRDGGCDFLASLRTAKISRVAHFSATYRGGARSAARVRGSEKCRNILALNGHFT
jgi:hypothetical protein